MTPRKAAAALLGSVLSIGCEAAPPVSPSRKPPADELASETNSPPSAVVANVVSASGARPSGIDDGQGASQAALSIVELDPSAGPLGQQVRLHARRGAQRGDRVVLEMGAPWCQPCRRAKAILLESAVRERLSGVVILRANSDVWGEDLDALGFDAPVIPVYYRLSSDGSPSGVSVRGDRWKSTAQVRTGLLAFLSAEDAR